MEVRFKNWGVPVKIRSEDVYESNLTAWKETIISEFSKTNYVQKKINHNQLQ